MAYFGSVVALSKWWITDLTRATEAVGPKREDVGVCADEHAEVAVEESQTADGALRGGECVAANVVLLDMWDG